MMKKFTRLMAIMLSMMLVFFNEPFIYAQDQTADFSDFITSASLEYQDGSEYSAYTQKTDLTSTTPLLFKIEADLPSSSLSSDHKINYDLPEGLNLEDTTSTDIYLKGDETHSVGTYTISHNKMVLDFSSLDFGEDQSKTILLEIKTTPSHLTFVDSEAKIYFKKASTTSPHEVMISVMQSYKDTSDQISAQETAKEEKSKVKTVKRALRKNTVKQASNGTKEIKDVIDDLVNSGLSGNYKLVGQTSIDKNIGNNPKITINKDVTIDLNGNKLQLYDGVYFDITANGHLTIIDSKSNDVSINNCGTTENKGNLSSVNKRTQNDHDNRQVPIKLDYYITKAEPNDTTTKDTTTKYEADLSSAGRIYSETGTNADQDSTFFVEKGGTLDFKSGVAYNTGKHVVATKNASNSQSATFNLLGGYLIGNRNGSVIYNNPNSKVNVSGGLITQGKASSGGGIYNVEGIVDLSGGIITGNEASGDGDDTTGERFSGGGIYTNSGTLNISGDAFITNNKKTDGTSTGNHASVHGGGGIAADNNAEVNMSGGYVTGNYSHEAGGGMYIGYFAQSGNTKLTLTGGTIASNVAETGEGGGIRIGGQGRATVRATSKSHPIYITNNKTNTGTNNNFTGDWGGGGIFVQTNGQMTMMNALITKNKAGGFGAGVSACPTGNTKIVTEQGAAIYDNTASKNASEIHCSGGSNGKNEDAVAYKFYNDKNRTDYQDYFLAHAKDGTSHTITDAMLGGGSEGYTGTFNQESRTSTEQEYNYDNQTAVFIGLSASPIDSDKSKALALASTYISGNYSHNHGGGIMTNGMLTLGESNDVFPSFQLNAYKAFLLSSADGNSSTKLAMKKDQFKFALYKHTGSEDDKPSWDGSKFTNSSGNTLVSEFGNDAADANVLGKISAEIPNVYYDEAGKYTFYLVEEDTENSKISYDHSIYKITFEVNPTGTETKDNLQTTTYSIQKVNVSKITDGTATDLDTKDYNFSNNLLMLYSSSNQAFTNKEQSYDFNITKNDKNHEDKLLSGAEFTLYQLVDQDKNQTALIKPTTATTNNGQAVFSSLRKEHTYYLKETKAPAHYETAGPWIIQVSDKGELTFYEADCSENSDCTTLTKNNSKTFVKGDGTKLINKDNVYSTTISDTAIKYTMPSTGGTGIHGYYQLGILFLILGNVFWMIKRRAV